MDLIRRNQEYRNFVSIQNGLTFVGEKLQGYTENKLDETFKAVYKKLAGKPPCFQQCSKVHKDKTARWCDTCNSWRRELTITRLNQHNISWSSMDSSNWSASYTNIAEVYLPSSWNNPDFQDVGTACHIWTNLKTCKINKWTIKRMKQVRNVYVAHNSRQSSTDVEKSEAFDVFTDSLKDADVNICINSRECIDELFRLKDANDIQMANIEQYLAEVKNWQTAWILHSFCKHILFFLKRTAGRISFNWKAFKKFYTFIVLFVIFLLASLFPFGEIHQQECISEQYSIPFKQDLPLLPYLSGHSSFIGRKWLFNDLHRYLLSDSPDENTHGIILAAEMGYGKSAIVYELLCQKNNQEEVQELRQHIVAFHICKFDVRPTHDPGRLIRRLVGFLAMKSAEFGNSVSMLPDSSLLYDKEGCKKEPDACFDQGITFPLKQLKDIENPPWIIAIDALDECETSGHNDILQLLIQRTKDLPKWLKLVVTSRNMTSLSRLRQTKLKHLVSNDKRNQNDLKTFINLHLPESPSKLRVIDDLLANSDGNFVYVVQAVSWLLVKHDSKILPELPADLGNVYEINFDRQFGDAELYAIPKMILEIVCSTINPIDKTDIYAILKENGALYNVTEFNHYFNTLSFFLNVDNGVRVKHQALFYWLTSEKNLHYRISLQAGHVQISTYLFSISNANKSVDLVDLAIHVGNSDDSNLKKIFISTQMVSEDIVNKKNLLHKLVWKTSSGTPLELMLEQLPYVDHLNEGNVTAAFEAASKGNVDQLQLLHKKGADINFRVIGNFIVYSGNISYKIELMKRLYYSGYTMLHIAAQHGHLNVVRYLLQHNITLLHVKNSLGLHAGHVACENGHIHVIEEMVKVNSTLFGYECLYYASKHNHRHVVEWLVSRGVKFECISNQMSEEALNEMQPVFTVMLNLPWVVFLDEDNLLPTINPLDKWWIIYKFNPLLEAIRMGSLTTAAFLIESFPDALDCSDAFGFSAALSSVVYNRSDLFPRIKDRITTDTCGKMPLHIVNSSQHDILEMSKNSYCPENGGLAHILALYPSKQHILYFTQHLFKAIQWNLPDKLGNYPIHYAVSNNNLLFITLIRERFSLINDTRTRNGSTPYHIAVTSGGLTRLYALTDCLNLPIPELKDENQQGILHHVAQMPFDDQTATFEKEKQGISLLMFDILINKFCHDLMILDAYGRNVLHYALKYGHFYIVNHLIQWKNFEFNTLVHQKDLEGYHPIEYALKNYQRDVYFMTTNKGKRPYFNVFSIMCTKEFDHLAEHMSSLELSLYLVIANMSYSESLLLFEPVLSHIWLKSSYLMTAVMFWHKYRNEQILRQLVIQNEVTGVTKYNQLMLVHYVPSVYRVCGEILVNSPLHYIMLHFDFKDTLFGFNKIDQNIALEVLFPKSKANFGFSCKDKNGFNIFHYALIGGNIEGARLFMNHGIEVFYPHVSIRKIFLMALQAPLRSVDNLVWCSLQILSQESCTDLLLRDLLRSHKHDFAAKDICINGSSDLSPIHLLTANGMLRTVKLLVKMFSSSILTCKNIDGFTPLYFGKIFSEKDVVSFIERKSNITVPHRDAEQMLLLYLLNGFSESGTAGTLNPFKCTTMFSSSYKQNKKWYHCIKSVFNHRYFITHRPFLSLSVVGTIVLDTVEYTEHCIHILDTCMSARRRMHCYISSCFNIDCINNLRYLANNFSSLFLFSKEVATEIIRKKKIPRLLYICITQINDIISTLACTEEIAWKYGSLLVSLRALMRTVRSDIESITIEYYLQGMQSIPINVTHYYEFLQQRIVEHQFNTSRRIEDPVVLIKNNVIRNFNHFQYLQILRSILSVRELMQRTYINMAFFSNYTVTVETEIRSIKKEILIEPFKDLK